MEKVLNFKQWFESMSVYVSDYEYQNDIKDVEDIANQLKRKVIYPAWEKLSPEQQELVKDGGSYYHHILTPDGDYYHDSKNSILNFYTSGWGDMATKLIQGIKYFLEEMGVKYGPFKTEKSKTYPSEVIRIPILHWKPPANTPPLLNLSNANADLIFGQLLKFPSDSESGYFNVSPADLLRKIEELERSEINANARTSNTEKTPGKVTVHNIGLSGQDISMRLKQIKDIAVWALKNHYDRLHVA